MTELSRDIRAVIERYWSAFFGWEHADWAQPTCALLPHAALGSYQGLVVFERPPVRIISAPPAWLAPLQGHTAVLAQTPLKLLASVLSAAGLPLGQRIGPAWIGYTTTPPAQPAHPPARLLHDKDAPLIDLLRSDCAPLEWEHGGSELGVEPLAGAFLGEALIALSGYSVWGDSIAHISVISHPDYRGLGGGRAAVALLTAAALQRDLIAQYRTLTTNHTSLRIARRLGFVEYAHTLAYRLQPEQT